MWTNNLDKFCEKEGTKEGKHCVKHYKLHYKYTDSHTQTCKKKKKIITVPPLDRIRHLFDYLSEAWQLVAFPVTIIANYIF